MEDREFTRPPEEYPRPGAEYRRDPELEYGALPEEFALPGASVPEPEPPRKKRRLRKWVYAVAGLGLSAALCFHAGVLPLPEGEETPEPGRPRPTGQVTPPPEGSLPPEEGPEATAEPSPEPTPEPTPTPTPPPVWPLEGDTEMLIVVFNNEIFFDGNEWGPRILLQEVIPESEFTDLKLPAPEINYDEYDWEPAGYAIHYNFDMDPNYDPDSETASFVVALEGDTLTRADVERIPRHSDGHRYIFIHVIWRSTAPEKYDEWDYKLELVLDDGLGHETVWEGDTPYASEGCTYLAAFPVPEREGYTFTGWYDGEGNRVDYLTYFDFFANKRLVESEYGTYWDADWDHPVPVELTAGWEKN